MLELSKTILSKVSFDRKLFIKELYKALGWVKKEEAIVLRDWCKAEYGTRYEKEINEAFNKMAA